VRLVGQRVAAVEEAPQRFVDFAALMHGELDALFGDTPTFLLDLLAFVTLQTGQQFAEFALWLGFVLGPVELHAVTQQPAGALEGFTVGLINEEQVS